MKHYRYFIVAALLFSTLHSPMEMQAQSGISRRALLELTEPEPMHKSVLRFDTLALCFGRMKEEDKPITLEYHYTNLGQKAVTIQRITTSCGCLSAGFSSKPIQPGEKGKVQLTFSPKGYCGHIYRQAYVYTDLSDKKPTVRLTLEGEVAPPDDKWYNYRHRLGVLRTKRKEVRFIIGRANRGAVQVEAVACVNTGTLPLKLAAEALPPYLEFRTMPTNIQPEEEADLIIRLNATKLPADAKGTLSVPIVLSGLEGTPQERTMNVLITLQD